MRLVESALTEFEALCDEHVTAQGIARADAEVAAYRQQRRCVDGVPSSRS